MKVSIDNANPEEMPGWTLTGEKHPANIIHLRIGDNEAEANILVRQEELIKMINVLVDLKNG